MLASLGVALSVSMVLVVWSVMGGFLDTLLDSGKQLIGDVVIRRPVQGIPHYQQLAERLEQRNEIAAAAPVVETVGMLNLPGLTRIDRFGRTITVRDAPKQVIVLGIDPQTYDQVTGLHGRLHWRPLDPDTDDAADNDPRLDRIDTDRALATARTLTNALADTNTPAKTIQALNADIDKAAEQLAQTTSNADAREILIPLLRSVGTAAWPTGNTIETTPDEDALTELLDQLQLMRLRQALIPRLDELHEHGKTLREPDPRADQPNATVPAALLGLEVSGQNRRLPGGVIVPSVGSFMPAQSVTLSVAPISGRGAVLDTVDRRFAVANEFRTGLFETDSKTVIVPIDELQQMLSLDERQVIDPDWSPGPRLDPDTGEFTVPDPPVIGIEPARATSILILAAPGITPEQLQPIAESVYESFASDNPDAPGPFEVNVFQWRDQPGLRTFIAAVEKETALVLFLFTIISITAVVLILAIFWSMVSEKTKDIGILRSVGASRLGITWLFVRYGLAIGLLGSTAGLILAALIVSNINAIHTWLGQTFDLVIWDPSVYYFFEIPSDLDPARFAYVFAGGVVSSVAGAVIPALRAASLDPVKALRFE